MPMSGSSSAGDTRSTTGRRIPSPPRRLPARAGVDHSHRMPQPEGPVGAGHHLRFLSHRPPTDIRRTPGGARLTRTIGGLSGALDRVVRNRGGTWEAWAAVPPTAANQDVGPPIRAVRLREA